MMLWLVLLLALGGWYFLAAIDIHIVINVVCTSFAEAAASVANGEVVAVDDAGNSRAPSANEDDEHAEDAADDECDDDGDVTWEDNEYDDAAPPHLEVYADYNEATCLSSYGDQDCCLQNAQQHRKSMCRSVSHSWPLTNHLWRPEVAAYHNQKWKNVAVAGLLRSYCDD